MTPRVEKIVKALKSPICTGCNIEFENMERLNVHMRVKHQETDDMKIVRFTEVMQASMTREPSIQIIKSLDCTECGVIFGSEIEMKIHNDKHHDGTHDLLRVIKSEEVESQINGTNIN